jgi:predicted metal-dependent peptidase
MFFDEESLQSARDRYSEALAFIMLSWRVEGSNEVKKPAHAFFHTFAQSLRYTETDGFDLPMGGKSPLALAAVGFTPSSPIGKLFINPDNFMNLDLLQASGLVVHEILHIVYDHLHYEQARTHPKIWNIATDCTINQQVVAMKYALPAGKGILNEAPEQDVKCITPEVLGEAFKCAPPKADENALFYFNWLLEKLEEENKKRQKQKPGPCQECGGTGKKEKKDGQDSQEGQQGQDGQQPGDKGDSQDGQQGGDSGDQPGDGDGSGEGQGQGGSGGSSPGGHGAGGSEPCDCCNGSGQQPGGQGGSGGGSTVDELLDELNGYTNHKHWEDLSPEEKEIVRQYEAQAAAHAKSHHEGMTGLPGDIAGQIGNKIKALEPEIDWQENLRRFVGGIGTCDLKSKRTRLNKYDLPGKFVMQPNSAIAVVCDTSGSVSDAEFGKFMAELVELTSTFNTAVYLINCDAAVQSAYWFDEEGDGDVENFDRHGYGGTCMSDAFNMIQEMRGNGSLDIGGVVNFTDGELPQSSFMSKGNFDLPLLYVFTRETSKWPDGSKEITNEKYVGDLIYFKNKAKKLGT